MLSHLKYHWENWLPLGVIVIIFVVLGVNYSITTPIWETPDETGHFGNVWHIVENGELPKPGTFDTWHHSPLYHLIAAAIVSRVEMSEMHNWYRSNPNSPTINFPGDPNLALHSIQELAPYHDISLAIKLARWVNIFFGAVTVVVTYILAKRIFPNQIWIAIGAASLVAFNPMYIFMSAAVQNDAPLSAAFALTMLPALSIVQGDYRVRQFLWLGGLVGLAIIFKQSGIVLIGVAGVVVLWAAWQSGDWQNVIKWGRWTALTWALVAGPMYIRNTVLYGDPLAYRVHKSLHPPAGPMDFNEITFIWLSDLYEVMHRSFWGQFGWMSIRMPQEIYTVLGYIYPFALIGLLLWLWRGRQSWAPAIGGLPTMLLLLLGMVAVWTFTFRYILDFGGFGKQGRYLFQLISAQSILLSLGLYSLTPGKLRFTPVLVVLVGLFGLAAWVPGQVIAPNFTYYGDRPEVLNTLQYPRNDVFGDAIKLAGYNTQANLSDEQMTVTLYWQVRQTPPEDYTVFVQLIDTDGGKQGQHDRRPLDGAFPTQAWRSNDVVHTDHTLTFPKVCQDGHCYLLVGFYNFETGDTVPVTEGLPFGNAVKLDQF